MEEYFVPFRTVLAYMSYGLYVALSDMYTQIFDEPNFLVLVIILYYAFSCSPSKLCMLLTI